MYPHFFFYDRLNNQMIAVTFWLCNFTKWPSVLLSQEIHEKTSAITFSIYVNNEKKVNQSVKASL